MVWLESLSSFCILALLCEKSRELFFHICAWKETENVCVRFNLHSQAKRTSLASQAFKIDLNTDSEVSGESTLGTRAWESWENSGMSQRFLPIDCPSTQLF